jgi:hypothetical protein
MDLTEDDRPPADPLAVIAHERAEAEHRLTPDPRLFLWPWGFAWLIGFALFFLRHGPDGRVFVAMPGWLPLLSLLGLTMAAGVATGIAGAHAGRHLRGASSRQGALYGITWSVAFAGMSTVLARFNGELPDERSALLWAGVLVGLTGALHMAGGAMMDDRNLFVLGLVISVANMVGILFGSGWHALVVAIMGGGGMLLSGFLGWLRWRR